jgi:acetolactate decarboxylase
MNQGRFRFHASIIIFSVFFLCGCACPEKKNEIYQVSTMGALMAGLYDGIETAGDLKTKGDFGLGTFEGLDGELIELDGKIFKISLNGTASFVRNSEKIPFAVTTFFKSDKNLILNRTMDSVQLRSYIDSILPSKNIPYAIKISGEFSFVKTRSVPKYQKPYPTLTEAVKNQQIREFHNIRGTLVGFWIPEYLGGVNLAGFHMHFLTHDKRAGGHLLDCVLEKGALEIAYITEFYLKLPKTADYWNAELFQGNKADLIKAEGK